MSVLTNAATYGAQFSHEQMGNGGIQDITTPDFTGRSDFERGWDASLDFIESDGVQDVMLYGGIAGSGAIAGTSALLGGATLGAAGVAALGATVAAGGLALVGMASGYVGNIVGGAIGHAVMGGLLGMDLMGDGEMPATVGHPIAHTSGWGLLGALALGALIAVVGFATFGVGAVAIALVMGAAIGATVGFASAAGQYGTNKGEIIQGSPNVWFQNKPVARVTDKILCQEHGGPQFVAQGAETVFANGLPIARIGHETTCGGKINDGVPSIAIDLDTSAIQMDIDRGWSDRLFRTAIIVTDFLPFPRGGKGPNPDAPNPRPRPDGDAPNTTRPDGGDTAPRPDATPNPHRGPDGDSGPNPNRSPDGDGGPNPNRTPDGDGTNPNNRRPDESANSDNTPNTNRTSDGDPVDVASGQVAETRTDISIPGTVPLVLTRSYRPGCEGIQGRHWAGTWAQHLKIDGDTITFQNEDGVLIDFHAPRDDIRSRNIRFPHLTLEGSRSGEIYIYDRRRQMFTIFGQRLRNRLLLSRIEDRNGNRIRFLYDDNGLREVRHSDGFSLSVESRDMLIRRAVLNAPDSSDCGFVWTYTPRNMLAEVMSSQTGTLRYGYDDRERLTSWADTRDTHATYEYGAHGRVVRNWSQSGHLNTRFDYDLAARRTVVTDALGAVTLYDWTDRGVVWRRTDPMGGEWLTEWGRHFNVLSTTDPLGNVTRYDYDDWGDLIRVTDPAGHSESWSYYLSGRIQSHTDKPGGKTVFRYDDNGNLASIQRPDGNFIRYRRAENGQILRIDYPGNRQERYAYDLLRRPRMLRTVAGFEQHMQFDGEGRLTRFSDEIGAETRWDHRRGPDNPRGAMRSVTLADGSVTQAEYDSEGLRIAATNGEGATRRYHFGAFDLAQGMTDEQGHELRFEHDALTRLTAVVNQKGERYALSYDACGRLIAERDYAGLVTTYQYDIAGRLLGSRAPDGTLRSYLRDALGQMIQVTHTRGTEVSRTRFAYDAAGRIIRADSAESTVEFAYDQMGQVVSEKQNGREIRSEYATDGAGRIARTGDVLELAASYNVAGQMAELRIGDHAPLHFAYDPRGLETLRHSDAGFALTQGHNTVGLLVEQIAGPLSALPDEVRYGALTGDGRNEHLIRAGALTHRSYLWDRAHRAIAVNDRMTGEKCFDHDARGQVVGVLRTDRRGENPVLSRFGYDANQNLTEIATGMSRDRVEQDAGRTRQRGRIHYRHDDAGRVVEKRVEEPGFRPRIWKMGWNAQGQLARLETPEGAVWRYVYDAMGRRTLRLKLIDGASENRTEPGFTPAGQGRAYQWEGRRIVTEAPLTDARTPAWEAGKSWVYQGDSFAPLARIAGDDSLYYIVNDHLGTPREMICEDGSSVAWRQNLSLWGQPELDGLPKPSANDDHPPQDCPIRFQGQWQDAESGLCYNNHRYYDPEATQYVSPDPLRLLGGIRPQGYVDNPNARIDPLGLSACAFVDDNGTLNLRNKFADPNDPAYDRAKAEEFDAFVQLWNEQAQSSPNGFTRQRMTPQLTRDAMNFRARARRWLDSRGMTDLAPGHLPDTAWGGLADPGDAWVPLDRDVNSYIGGLTQGVTPGTTYTSVTSWF